MIWTCSLGIHKQFRRETWTAISWITKEIANNDVVQLTIFGKSDFFKILEAYYILVILNVFNFTFYLQMGGK
jgi:hypothetical protein